MDQSQQATLLELQLTALTAQASAARQAHIAICDAAGIKSNEELDTLTASLTQLVQLARESASTGCPTGVCATVHSYHAELDLLLQRATRLLQDHRDLVQRALRRTPQPSSDGRSTMTYERDSYSLYAQLAVLEAYLVSVRGIANQALSFVIGGRLTPASRA